MYVRCRYKAHCYPVKYSRYFKASLLVKGIADDSISRFMVVLIITPLLAWNIYEHQTKAMGETAHKQIKYL
jgi:hypothetical protein